MTNQSPIFNEQFEIVAMNIKYFLKELEQQENFGCFLHIQVELNE